MLAVVETHPIQYHAPLYRVLEQRCGVPVTAIYGSDFSIAGYHDPEFQAEFSWDTDLLSGYSSVFLSRTAAGGARDAAAVSPRGLRRALTMVQPWAVMVVGYSPSFHRAAWLEAWRGRYPTLFRGETNDETRLRNPLHDRLRSMALTLAYRRCTRLLYIGKRSHAHFRRLGVSEDRLVFSPYCVDASSFDTDEIARQRLRPRTRSALGASERQLVLLYSGKLSERKGVSLVIDAIRALAPSVRDHIMLVCVGDGPQREGLLALASAAPHVHLVWVGFKNQRQLSSYYHAADLLVLPSRHSETWGLVVNEALHHGVPCIVSDGVGCAPDLIDVGRTGLVFQSGSVSSLKSAVTAGQALCGRPELREACRQKASGYSVDRAAEGIAQAYAAAITPRRS